VHITDLEAVMALQFLGIDPNTRNGSSPTVWIDDTTGDYILQGWKITDPGIMADVQATGPVPDHEAVIRFPRRMMQFFPEVSGGND
jgi:hypothetical protein